MGEPIGEGPTGWKLYSNPFFYSTHHHRRRHHVNRPAAVDLEALKAELDEERRLRKEAEVLLGSISGELEEERRRRAAAEREVGELSAEVERVREEMGRVRAAVGEERRVMRMTQVMREEKAQTKLTEARIQMEERLAGVSRAPRKEVENPHIRRGIIGFVEFPRMLRAREGKSGEAAPKLECQKAQLRVLMRKSSNRVNPVAPEKLLLL